MAMPFRVTDANSTIVKGLFIWVVPKSICYPATAAVCELAADCDQEFWSCSLDRLAGIGTADYDQQLGLRVCGWRCSLNPEYEYERHFIIQNHEFCVLMNYNPRSKSESWSPDKDDGRPGEIREVLIGNSEK
jgi:hypothetical protein